MIALAYICLGTLLSLVSASSSLPDFGYGVSVLFKKMHNSAPLPYNS